MYLYSEIMISFIYQLDTVRQKSPLINKIGRILAEIIHQFPLTKKNECSILKSGTFVLEMMEWNG